MYMPILFLAWFISISLHMHLKRTHYVATIGHKNISHMVSALKNPQQKGFKIRLSGWQQRDDGIGSPRPSLTLLRHQFKDNTGTNSPLWNIQKTVRRLLNKLGENSQPLGSCWGEKEKTETYMQSSFLLFRELPKGLVCVLPEPKPCQEKVPDYWLQRTKAMFWTSTPSFSIVLTPSQSEMSLGKPSTFSFSLGRDSIQLMVPAF